MALAPCLREVCVMKRPCLEDLSMAAEWLRCNEGADGESESCSLVATWLDTYARGSGLTGLRDRIEAVGGTFNVTSPAGGGTTLLIEIPV